MATIDEIYVRLGEIMERLRAMEDRRFSADQVEITEGMSDITDGLGLMKAGEIRFGDGVPGKGDGFTGLRLASENISSGSIIYLLLGAQADGMKWGVRSCDGVLDLGYSNLIKTADSDVPTPVYGGMIYLNASAELRFKSTDGTNYLVAMATT